ncbi:hypothetical protein B296_00034945 [Ensete ventricosum]|uniref:D-aminoacyl-tRNA deacylase n=1 Tax=Ensete ventricosum TaxID=4639 RepID=A0A426XJP1_ENSVE|nr:hypothetical protein B296_00034945 [Ensete ventricosum]
MARGTTGKRGKSLVPSKTSWRLARKLRRVSDRASTNISRSDRFPGGEGEMLRAPAIRHQGSPAAEDPGLPLRRHRHVPSSTPEIARRGESAVAYNRERSDKRERGLSCGWGFADVGTCAREAQGYTIVQAATGGGGGRAMRAVVQRVLSASVEVEGRVVSEIGPGLLVLVGVHESDTDADADYICRKVLNMRLFSNSKTGKAWDLSVSI